MILYSAATKLDYVHADKLSVVILEFSILNLFLFLLVRALLGRLMVWMQINHKLASFSVQSLHIWYPYLLWNDPTLYN